MPRSSDSPRGLRGLRAVVVGTGAVGEALALGLARAGSAVSCASREPRRARALVARLRRERTAGSIAGASARSPYEDAEAVFLCVPDRVVEETAARCAAAPSATALRVALHTSGFLGSEALAPLADNGVATGSLHPLIALPRRSAGSVPNTDRLRGSWFAVEGAPRAVALARSVVRACGGEELRLAADPGAKAEYHAAAAMLSGGLVALFAAAERELAGAAVSKARARRALLALLASTVQNLERGPSEAALTGPVARGDAGTVLGHLAVLDAGGGGTGELYRALARRMLTLVADGLDDDQRGALEALLFPRSGK